MNKWEVISNSWTEENVAFQGGSCINLKKIYNSDQSLEWEFTWKVSEDNVYICNLSLEQVPASDNFTLWLEYYIEVKCPIANKEFPVRGIAKFNNGQSTLFMSDYQILEIDNRYLPSTTSLHFCVKLSSIITDVNPLKKLPNIVSPHAFRLSKDLSLYFNNRDFSDVKIFSGETELYAHKIILCARSSVFYAMFQNDALEKKTSCININNFEVDLVKLFIGFLYEGHVTISGMDVAVELLKAADFYDVTDLKELCVKYISDHVDQNNVVDTLLLSSLYEAPQIKKFTMECFLACPKKYDLSDIKKIEKQRPELLCDILVTVLDKYAEKSLVLDGLGSQNMDP